MTDHDPMCRGTRKEWNGPREYRHVCDCDLIARVRADAEADAQSLLSSDLDAARAEVDRLGQIVREQDEHATWMRQCWKAVAEERDEARADAIVATRERDAARAEVAALKQAWDTGIKAVEYRVLADLRAKVEGLRRTTEVAWDGDYVTLVQLREVLALIGEEAQ